MRLNCVSASIRKHFGKTGISLRSWDAKPSVDIAACVTSSTSSAAIARDRDPRACFFAHVFKEIVMKAVISVCAVLALAVGGSVASPALADGYKNCTKLEKASWKQA